MLTPGVSGPDTNTIEDRDTPADRVSFVSLGCEGCAPHDDTPDTPFAIPHVFFLQPAVQAYSPHDALATQPPKHSANSSYDTHDTILGSVRPFVFDF